jgi:hypothetical protein
MEEHNQGGPRLLHARQHDRHAHLLLRKNSKRYATCMPFRPYAGTRICHYGRGYECVKSDGAACSTVYNRFKNTSTLTGLVLMKDYVSREWRPVSQDGVTFRLERAIPGSRNRQERYGRLIGGHHDQSTGPERRTTTHRLSALMTGRDGQKGSLVCAIDIGSL